MTSHGAPSFRARQRGAGLLLMLLVLTVGISAMLFARLNRSEEGHRTRHTERVLATAKQALIGYAVTTADHAPGLFGALPCPDIDASGGFAEGEAHAGACGASDFSVLGRLPWKTLGLAPPLDGDGECLWYAVSGSYKDAAGSPPSLLNDDTNGMFDVYLADGARKLAGVSPHGRAAAVIVAPGRVTGAQARTLGTGTERCRGNYTPGGYLEGAMSIDNAALSTPSAALSAFILGDADGTVVNDRFAVVTRAEIANAIRRRNDFAAAMQRLTQTAADCLANYGATNPGAGDLRLPWPAPLALADYGDPALYDDTTSGNLSGRLPDEVSDSSAVTGNSLTNLMSGCDGGAVPDWDAETQALWRHWKDHLFYAVAGDYAPSATAPTACGACLQVNGAGSYAAVVMFASARLGAQVRDAPPHDTDTRNTIANYLEGRNASNHPNAAGNGDYESASPSASFNDVLYCVDAASLAVSPC